MSNLRDIRLHESGFGFVECIRDARTIGASPLCIRIRIPKSNIPLIVSEDTEDCHVGLFWDTVCLLTNYMEFPRVY